MAILQGLISLLTRSVGKIFSALFDWAVVALFGRVEGRQKIWLSALMGAAAVWPVLLLGVAYIGWQRRVTRPLAVTRKTLTEDMQWVKERLA